ncbi:MAG: plasmid mobilization protein [Lachnospiraceae bacterium]
MSGTHKYPTISFRVSPRERQEIEARILASGLQKKDYFIRSCIYNRVCVVGKKETVYVLVERMAEMEQALKEMELQIVNGILNELPEDIQQVKHQYIDMLKAILWMLDGAKYLWKENAPED